MSEEKPKSEYGAKALENLKNMLENDAESDPQFLPNIDDDMAILNSHMNTDQEPSDFLDKKNPDKPLSEVYKDKNFTSGLEHRMPPEKDEEDI